ncbi:hypothetical protein [Niallia endozanthoxylica]|uniref:Uncharacterized protein n=1 Tax=Niallia endozanthoxylica TaxID=2036016 RepID=A0A5J5HXE1_9BACI|nr:hypothetical protein [Niallia endozanthoxylica]KAA9026318.1 hypothetical protein F4V44_10660 [Niallia endozanthoxylica]
MLRFLFLSAILLYLLSTLLPDLGIDPYISILCLIIVICTIGIVKRFVRVLGSIFLSIGLLLLWTSGTDWKDYIASFGPMLDLLTLFSLVPILGIPIKLGEYSESIKTVIHKKVKTTGKLYMLTSGISYFFSIFMNLATLPMTYFSIRPALDSFPIKQENRFLSRAITRGFAMPLLWAPVTPIVGIVVGMTGVSWLSILPYVLPLSVMGLLLDWFLGRQKSTTKIEDQPAVSASEFAAAKESSALDSPYRVLQILLAIVLFIIVISTLETYFDYSFIILVSLLVIPFSFIWALLLRKGNDFFVQLIEHFKSFTVSMKDQFFIFLSAGFLISTIQVSHSNEFINKQTIHLINVMGAEFFLILLPLIPLGLAFVGLHPAVSLSLMAGALNPTVLGISPYVLTVAMLTGAVTSFLVGPYNATIGLMSNIIKESSFKVSNWNLAFTGLYVGLAMVYLIILEMLI